MVTKRVVTQRAMTPAELEEWLDNKKLDNYEIPASNKNVKDILGDEAYKILQKGSKKNVTTCRGKFIEFLKDKTIPYSSPAPGEPITLEALLSEKGKDLFLQAIKEEYASENFRNAVAQLSLEEYPGPKWKKPMIVFVGGPSGSGKSYNTSFTIEKAVEQFEKNSQKEPSQQNESNILASIDGGNERKVSQMNQLVLQLALQAGCVGIEDLHTASGLPKKIKTYLKKAVFASKNELSVALPETFRRQYKVGIYGHIRKWIIGSRMEKLIKKCSNKYNYVYCGIKAEKASVRFQAENRAFLSKPLSGEALNKPLQINNRDLKVESKKYSRKSFDDGKKANKIAQKEFGAACNKHKVSCASFEVDNDSMFVTIENNKLVSFTDNDDISGDKKFFRISKADLKEWENWSNKNPAPEAFEVWRKWLQDTNDIVYFKVQNNNGQHMLVNCEKNAKDVKVANAWDYQQFQAAINNGVISDKIQIENWYIDLKKLRAPKINLQAITLHSAKKRKTLNRLPSKLEQSLLPTTATPVAAASAITFFKKTRSTSVSTPVNTTFSSDNALPTALQPTFSQPFETNQKLLTHVKKLLESNKLQGEYEPKYINPSIASSPVARSTLAFASFKNQAVGIFKKGKSDKPFIVMGMDGTVKSGTSETLSLGRTATDEQLELMVKVAQPTCALNGGSAKDIVVLLEQYKKWNTVNPDNKKSVTLSATTIESLQKSTEGNDIVKELLAQYKFGSSITYPQSGSNPTYTPRHDSEHT